MKSRVECGWGKECTCFEVMEMIVKMMTTAINP
jgi:hypothetical protein